MIEIYGKQVCETLDEVLAPQRCAVIVVDMQNDFISPKGKVAEAGGNIEPMLALVPKCVAFIDACRELGIPLVHVRVADLPGGLSDSPASLRAKRTIANVANFAEEGTWGAEFVEGCEPHAGETVVTKHRSSAFVGTNLDLILRASGIETVVVIGEQTPGCIEATYRDAAYFDYYNVLIEDCIAARDQALHDASILIQKARHDVCTADVAIGIWRRARALAAPTAPLAAVAS